VEPVPTKLMTLKFTTDRSSKKVLASLKNVKADSIYGIEKFWWALGKDLKASANKAILARPRQGRVYTSRNKAGARRRHTASRASESPANRSGVYRKSIGFDVQDWENMEFGAGAEYAGYLENGTSRMAPRPRSEEHTSEFQSREPSSYAVTCLQQNKLNRIANSLSKTSRPQTSI